MGYRHSWHTFPEVQMALQQEIIQALGAKPQIDAQQEIRH